MLTLLLVAAISVGWSVERGFAHKKLQAQLRTKQREARNLAQVQPAPTPENEALVAADLEQANAALAAMRADLTGRSLSVDRLKLQSVPERRPDAFFDIADFVERMRFRAEQAGVGLKSDERFGFAEFAHVGPEQDEIPAVFRQRLVMQYLLEQLFDARPERLLTVRRERPTSATSRDTRATTTTASADLFEVDPRMTARVPGFVDATAFRLEFTGGTGTLRTFLNRLSTFELPLVVRSVEVERQNEPAGLRTSEGEIAPLVVPATSRFTVTVEYIELTEPAS
ncbi:MAG: Amuc_1100 family pilus-like protein [Opitutus sp.]|nr:Amuc_1100 family pilus-like protein [Opitutus sp.]